MPNDEDVALREAQKRRDNFAAEERRAWDLYAASSPGPGAAQQGYAADLLLVERRKRFPNSQVP